MRPEVKFDDLTHYTEKQKEATKALKQYKYILYGGAMGGGKSYWLRWSLVDLLTDWAQKGYRGVRVGLFCEDYPSLKDRHISKIQYEFPEWLGSLNKSDYEFTLAEEYGSGVICFRNLDDPSKYQSSEFAAIAVDELTKNQKEVFDFLRTRLRWSGLEDTKFIAGSNPGGIGHGWVKKLWMDKQFEEGEQEKDLFYFIPAKAVDNPHLSQSYFTSLEGLPPEMRKAFVEGNWDLFKGQYFTEWNRERHTCQPFQIPDNWVKFRAYDHGREAPACCYWCAVDENGRVWVYCEYYEAGKNVDGIAKDIIRLSGNESYKWSVADTSIFAKQGMVDKWGGETIAQNFMRHGIHFIPASKRRVDGWNLMHQYLYYNELQQPKLIFFNICHNAIRTIPALIHDTTESRLEDVDSLGEDHSADTIRYMLMSLKEAQANPPLSELEKKLNALREQEDSFSSDFYEGKQYQLDDY